MNSILLLAGIVGNAGGFSSYYAKVEETKNAARGRDDVANSDDALQVDARKRFAALWQNAEKEQSRRWSAISAPQIQPAQQKAKNIAKSSAKMTEAELMAILYSGSSVHHPQKQVEALKVHCQRHVRK